MCNVPNGGRFDLGRFDLGRFDHNSFTYTVSRDANGQLYYSYPTSFNPNYF
jgi:hypothetical protein